MTSPSNRLLGTCASRARGLPAAAVLAASLSLFTRLFAVKSALAGPNPDCHLYIFSRPEKAGLGIWKFYNGVSYFLGAGPIRRTLNIMSLRSVRWPPYTNCDCYKNKGGVRYPSVHSFVSHFLTATYFASWRGKGYMPPGYQLLSCEGVGECAAEGKRGHFSYSDSQFSTFLQCP